MSTKAVESPELHGRRCGTSLRLIAGFSRLCRLFAATLWCVGCNAIIGLDDFSVRTPTVVDAGIEELSECSTNLDCNLDGSPPATCLKPEERCVPLLSADCQTITGDYLDDGAILIGSLFSLTGTQAVTNLPRQQSAALAVQEINAAGGVPKGRTSAGARPLVLVSCDESVDLMRAGSHLVTTLRVPAIVGPNTSQDTLDLSNELTITNGTAVLTPSALASSIADLLDDGLTWQMAPNDMQRGPLMIQQINALEAAVRAARAAQNVRLAVVFRDDALGIGTQVSLNSLVINGAPLSDPVNLGSHVLMKGYDFSRSDQPSLVAELLAFQPDIVVLAGTAEVVTDVMVPLERDWPVGAPRPSYLVIDPVKAADLLAAVAADDDLRKRVRGTGVTPSERSRPVYEAFRVSYDVKYPGSTSGGSGMGPAYDAVYAIAFAIAGHYDLPINGRNIARGLRKLSGGTVEVELQRTQVLAGFQHLVAGSSISAIGTFAPLVWNTMGALQGGTLEMWCIGLSEMGPVYQSSGLTHDLALGRTSGEYVPCSP